MISRIKPQAIGSTGWFPFVGVELLLIFWWYHPQKVILEYNLVHTVVTEISFSKQHLLTISCETLIFSILLY